MILDPCAIQSLTRVPFRARVSNTLGWLDGRLSVSQFNDSPHTWMITRCKMALERAASFPPLRSSPLPLQTGRGGGEACDTENSGVTRLGGFMLVDGRRDSICATPIYAEGNPGATAASCAPLQPSCVQSPCTVTRPHHPPVPPPPHPPPPPPPHIHPIPEGGLFPPAQCQRGDLRQRVRSCLKDDEQYADGRSDLVQDQV